MKIFFIGDIFGRAGRRAVASFLPKVKKEHQPDLVIANAENLAGGVSTTTKTLAEMRAAGVDFFTGGNHSFHDLKYFSEDPVQDFLRPANIPEGAPGEGYRIVNGLGIINLLGRIFIKNPTTCPFIALERILEEWKDEELKGIFVDLHAEATSEKAALFHAFAGRVSAMVGTHTHVPTADDQIHEGTYFLTDVGMTGPVDSIIGLEVKTGVENFRSPIGKKKLKEERGSAVFRGVLLDISDGKVHNAEKITFFESER